MTGLGGRVIDGQWFLTEPEVVDDIGVRLESRIEVGPGSPYEPEKMADSEVCLESLVSVGPGSPREPKEVAETGAWLELRIVGGPGPPWISQMMVDIEAWLPDLCLPKNPKGQKVLPVLFLFFYILTMVGNILIVLTVIVSKTLNSPMYFFLASLSFLDLIYSSSISP
ncbi:hypothetical protein Celaphus_00018713, partial [Cervus elaphus hippelaphus]